MALSHTNFILGILMGLSSGMWVSQICLCVPNSFTEPFWIVKTLGPWIRKEREDAKSRLKPVLRSFTYCYLNCVLKAEKILPDLYIDQCFSNFSAEVPLTAAGLSHTLSTLLLPLPPPLPAHTHSWYPGVIEGACSRAHLPSLASVLSWLECGPVYQEVAGLDEKK